MNNKTSRTALKFYIAVMAIICFFIPNMVLTAYKPDSEPIAKVLKENGSLIFKSIENKPVFIPIHLLSADCIGRLKRLDTNLINNKTITTKYSSDTLMLASSILVQQNAIKFVKKAAQLLYPVAKVQAYLTNAAENKLNKARQLCRALIFFGVNEECLAAIIKQCKDFLNCDEKELLYTYDNFFKELSDENIKSVVESEPAKSDKAVSYARMEFNAQVIPDAHKKRQLAFDLATRYAKNDPSIAPEFIIDTQSWQDLEVACGPKSNPQSSLAAAVDCTSSELGKVLLYSKILQPTSNTQQLQKRQQIVKAFLDNEEIFAELDDLFTDFFKEQKHENNVLSFLAGDDQVAAYFQYPQFSTEFFQKVAKWLSVNEVNVQLQEGGAAISFIIRDKVHDVKNKAAQVFLARLENRPKEKAFLADLAKVLPMVIKNLMFLGENISGKDCLHGCRVAIKGYVLAALVGSVVFGNLPAAAAAVISGYVADKILGISMEVIDSLMTGDADLMKTMAEINFCMHERLVLLSKYIKFMQKVNVCIDKLPELKQLLPSLNTLNIQQQGSLIDKFTGPAEYQQFINNVLSIGDDNESWYKYYFGRVIATYRLVGYHKENLVPSVMAMAELDMYLSIVRLYKKNIALNRPMCFAEFIDNPTNEPLVELENFWSPTVAENPVPNTLILGSQNKFPNALITGPNTGGKSTTMRGFIFSILMAQSLGVLPAHYCKLTPFTGIRAYLNITDDATQGLSLFKSSVLRAKQLIKKAQETSGYSLILFDELYNGTNPQGGESLAYGTLKDIGSSDEYKRALCIATTHFPCLKALAADPSVKFDYYRVANPEDLQNRFKILPGMYTDFNGFQVAQDTDMNASIIARAQQYYAEAFEDNPDRSRLLDCLENEAALQGFIAREAGKKFFIILVLAAPHNNRFFTIIEMHNFNLANVINLTDDLGMSVLHYAAMWDIKDKALIEKIIGLGANPLLQDATGKTPLDYAFEGSVMQKVLEEHFWL